MAACQRQRRFCIPATTLREGTKVPREASAQSGQMRTKNAELGVIKSLGICEALLEDGGF